MTGREMATAGRLALALALPAAAHGAFTAPMRGWMTWERYTCETDCTHFPCDHPPLPPLPPTYTHRCSAGIQLRTCGSAGRRASRSA